MRSWFGYLSPYVRSLELDKEKYETLCLELLGVPMVREVAGQDPISENNSKAGEAVKYATTLPNALESLSAKSYREEYGKETAQDLEDDLEDAKAELAEMLGE